MRSFKSHGSFALSVFKNISLSTVFLSIHITSMVSAQSQCNIPTAAAAKYPAPSMATGYQARIVASGLHSPRSIKFDSQGNLLVLEQSVGVTVLQLNDAGGDCVSVASKNTIIGDYTLNHGLELSADSKTLYVSSNNVAMRFAYDPVQGKTTSGSTQLVTGMSGTDHQTRTLFLSKKNSNMLLISRGSDDNIDLDALDLTKAHSTIKAFDLSKLGNTPYDFTSQGNVIGWGLRNSVGIAEHPITGGVFSVENSVDNISRNGQDFHTDDPGEELNFHGYMNGTTAGVQGKNYGYPTCVTTWSADIPDPSKDLNTGSPIAFGQLNSTNNDTLCKQNTIAPRLTFHAHWAPLDLEFNSNGTVGYMSSHGSTNRSPPSGYQLIGIPWDGRDGQPLAPATAQNSFVPIMSNQDTSKCPNNCFRPCGLAFDAKGRLWMTSDSTGEIYVITKSDGTSVDAVNGTSTARGPSGDGGGSGTVNGSGNGSGRGPHSGAAGPIIHLGVGRDAFMGCLLAAMATMLLI